VPRSEIAYEEFKSVSSDPNLATSTRSEIAYKEFKLRTTLDEIERDYGSEIAYKEFKLGLGPKHPPGEVGVQRLPIRNSNSGTRSDRWC